MAEGFAGLESPTRTKDFCQSVSTAHLPIGAFPEQDEVPGKAKCLPPPSVSVLFGKVARPRLSYSTPEWQC